MKKVRKYSQAEKQKAVQHYLSVKKTAKEIVAEFNSADQNLAGISSATIYKALGEKGNPTIDTLASILKTMGFKLTLTPIVEAS